MRKLISSDVWRLRDYDMDVCWHDSLCCAGTANPLRVPSIIRGGRDIGGIPLLRLIENASPCFRVK